MRLFLFLLFIWHTSFAEEVTGFWNTINDKNGKKESLVAIYEYQGKYFGRIVGVYDDQGVLTDNLSHPVSRAPAVAGNPTYAGLDLMWGFTKEGSLYKNGKIIDPEKGRIYDAEMWRKKDKLVLRGKVWIFGQNVIWDPVAESDFPPGFTKPDYTRFVPTIPEVQSSRK